jgi:hypothetical protein
VPLNDTDVSSPEPSTVYDDTIAEIVDDDPELTALIDAVADAEAALAEAQEQRTKVRDTLTQHLLLRGERTAVGTDLTGQPWRATVVSRDDARIDAQALKAKIGARAWNRLTERKLVNAKVAEAVASGWLSPQDVADVSEVKTSTSLRFVAEQP